MYITIYDPVSAQIQFRKTSTGDDACLVVNPVTYLNTSRPLLTSVRIILLESFNFL